MHILREGFLALILNWENGHEKGCTESVYTVLGVLFMVNVSNESRQSEAKTWLKYLERKCLTQTYFSSFNISYLMTSLDDPEVKDAQSVQ